VSRKLRCGGWTRKSMIILSSGTGVGERAATVVGPG